MNIALIMRGIPGSGKSTAVRELLQRRDDVVVCSTDDLRYDGEGKYVFHLSTNQADHERNFQAFCASIDRNVPVVVCDNTNITKKQWERYADYAKQSGYLVIIAQTLPSDAVTAAQRTIHEVPVSTIEKMLVQWEPS